MRATRPIAPTNEKSLKRFFAKVRKEENGCWMWTGHQSTRGYPQFLHAGILAGAHRVSYTWFCGIIPEGMHIDHLCNTPMCVNPAHLEPVTNAENHRRGAERRTSCRRGHDFTPENTVWEDTERGPRRRCRTCRNETAKRWYHRKKASGGVAKELKGFGGLDSDLLSP